MSGFDQLGLFSNIVEKTTKSASAMKLTFIINSLVGQKRFFDEIMRKLTEEIKALDSPNIFGCLFS
jgi:hypothetical protein